MNSQVAEAVKRVRQALSASGDSAHVGVRRPDYDTLRAAAKGAELPRPPTSRKELRNAPPARETFPTRLELERLLREIELKGPLLPDEPKPPRE